MFHHFWDAQHPRGQGALTAEEFAELLSFVGLPRILPAGEWLARALEDRLEPGELCLTFDDALRCQLDIALPVMRQLGLTAFWFVYSSVFEGQRERLEIYRRFRDTGFATMDDFYAAFEEILRASPVAQEVEARLRGFEPAQYLSEFPFYSDGDRWFRYVRDRILGPERYWAVMDDMLRAHEFDEVEAARQLWMTDSDLQALERQGHVVGAHSYAHPTVLADLPAEAQRSEYERNLAHLERVLDHKVVVMSHPCNSYSDTTLQILADLGLRLGFRSNMAMGQATSPMEYPREDHANVLRMMREQHHYS